jgi:hypothetical protein
MEQFNFIVRGYRMKNANYSCDIILENTQVDEKYYKSVHIWSFSIHAPYFKIKSIVFCTSRGWLKNDERPTPELIEQAKQFIQETYTIGKKIAIVALPKGEDYYSITIQPENT